MYSDRPTIFVRVFDIADRAEPVLLRDTALTGYFSTSRVIDNNLYLIANHYNQLVAEYLFLDDKHIILLFRELPTDCYLNLRQQMVF